MKNLLGVVGIGIGLGLGLLTSSYCKWRKKPVYRADLGVVAPRYADLDSVEGANRLLLDFPSQIPGAAGVGKYLTPDAKHCLVHILQAHPIENATEQEKVEIANTQADIYRILEHLVQMTKLKEVYAEGLDETLEPWLRQHENNVFKLRKDISRLEEELRCFNERRIPPEVRHQYPDYQGQWADRFVSFMRNMLEWKRESVENHKQKIEKTFEGQTIGQIAVKYEIRLLPAEDSSALQATIDLLRNANGDRAEEQKIISNNREVFYDAREQALLERIAERGDPLAVCVYGGGHGFGGRKSCGDYYRIPAGVPDSDSIACWNKEHPTEKFSLIEVIPKSFYEYFCKQLD